MLYSVKEMLKYLAPLKTKNRKIVKQKGNDKNEKGDEKGNDRVTCSDRLGVFVSGWRVDWSDAVVYRPLLAF